MHVRLIPNDMYMYMSSPMDFEKATMLRNKALACEPSKRHEFLCANTNSIENELVKASFGFQAELHALFLKHIATSPIAFLNWLQSINYKRKHLISYVRFSYVVSFVCDASKTGNVTKFIWSLEILKKMEWPCIPLLDGSALANVDACVPHQLADAHTYIPQPIGPTKQSVATWLGIFTPARVVSWLRTGIQVTDDILHAIKTAHPDLFSENMWRMLVASYVGVRDLSHMCNIDMRKVRKNAFLKYTERYITNTRNEQMRELPRVYLRPSIVAFVLKKLLDSNPVYAKNRISVWITRNPDAYSILSEMRTKDLAHLFALDIPAFSTKKALVIWTTRGTIPPEYVISRFLYQKFSVSRKLCDMGWVSKDDAYLLALNCLFLEREDTPANLRWVLKMTRDRTSEQIAALAEWNKTLKMPEKASVVIQTWWRRVYSQNERLRMNIARREYENMGALS